MAVCSLLSPFTNAALIVTWDVSGDSSPASLPADSVDATFVSNTPTVSRTGLGQNAGANSFNSNGWNLGAFSEASDYLSFTVTSNNNILSFTSLQYAINGSGTAPGTGRWGYSVAGGAFTLQTPFALTSPQPTTLAEWDFTDFGLTNGQSVEFRFWAWGATSINGGTSATGGTVRIANISGNDLVLNGIPEPTTFGAILLGALGLFGARRVKRAVA